MRTVRVSKTGDMNDDATKENYETANDWHVQKSLAHSWAREIDHFLSFNIPKSGRVLDAGCGGSGRDIGEFRKRGIIADGLDYSHAAIESLRSHFPDGNFYEASITDTGLDDAVYDGVWACATILNLSIHDAKKALFEFKRILKKGGVLFISVKEGTGEQMVPDRAGERFFKFFTQDELHELVENSGFQIEKVEIIESSIQKETRWICVYGINT